MSASRTNRTQQRGDAADALVAILALAVFTTSLIVGAMWLDSIACHSKWEHAGMAGVSWGPIKGCLVKLPDGRWLPEERIREIDIPKVPSK